MKLPFVMIRVYFPAGAILCQISLIFSQHVASVIMQYKLASAEAITEKLSGILLFRGDQTWLYFLGSFYVVLYFVMDACLLLLCLF